MGQSFTIRGGRIQEPVEIKHIAWKVFNSLEKALKS